MATKRKPKHPKYKSVTDLEPWTSATGKSGSMLPGAPMDLALARYEHDNSLRSHHKLTCCECGFRHLMTYEVYATNIVGGPRKGTPGWWLKIRAYGDDETRPKSVVDAGGKKRKC